MTAPSPSSGPSTSAQEEKLVTDEMVAEFELAYLIALYPDRHDFAGSAPGTAHFEAYRAGLAAACRGLREERDKLGQLLAHVHLHMTNAEEFGADELEADMRTLNAGKWIDTESLLLANRQGVEALSRENAELRKALQEADAIIARQYEGAAIYDLDVARSIDRHRAALAPKEPGK
jgi:hypothetical protein